MGPLPVNVAQVAPVPAPRLFPEGAAWVICVAMPDGREQRYACPSEAVAARLCALLGVPARAPLRRPVRAARPRPMRRAMLQALAAL